MFLKPSCLTPVRPATRRLPHATLLVALALGSAVLLGGCSTLGSMSASLRSAVGLGPAAIKPQWRSLVLSTTDDANGNSALAVDLVLVHDPALLETLLKTPASQWFATRQELIRSFPQGMSLRSYELAPGQTVRLTPAQWGPQPSWGALLYASYSTPGEHRERLVLKTPGYVVQLGASGFKAADLEPKNR